MSDLDRMHFEKYMSSIEKGRPKCFWCNTHILQGEKPVLSRDEKFERKGYTYSPVYEHKTCREAIENALLNRGYEIEKENEIIKCVNIDYCGHDSTNMAKERFQEWLEGWVCTNCLSDLHDEEQIDSRRTL
jgi:hypothetical protein